MKESIHFCTHECIYPGMGKIFTCTIVLIFLQFVMWTRLETLFAKRTKTFQNVDLILETAAINSVFYQLYAMLQLEYHFCHVRFSFSHTLSSKFKLFSFKHLTFQIVSILKQQEMVYVMMRITITFAILMRGIAAVQMQLCGYAMIVLVSGNEPLIQF